MIKYGRGTWTREDLLPLLQQCVGDGWADLVRRCLDLIPDGSTVLQVKEKFGGLRFYVSLEVDEPVEVWDSIDAVCNESFGVCEVCGEAGTRRYGGWVRTLCDEHAPAEEEE